MRYEVRWSNGAWKLFDTFMYTSVAAYGLRDAAEEAAQDANAGLSLRR